MMKFATFEHSNLLPLIVARLLQRQGEPSFTLILLNLRGGLDPLGGAGYGSTTRDSSTKDGNRHDPLIGAGDKSTIVGFCLLPNRASLIRATAFRAGSRWL